MKYKVIIKSEVEKQLNKLDNSIKLKILKYIKKNLNNTDNLKGFWRYRVENYRIIAKIEEDKLVILIVQVNKRDKIYI